MSATQTTIYLFRGRPGVGKTTISSAFAIERTIPILRKDDIYDIASLYLADHQTRNRICYDSMFKILETNSQNGTQLILDFPFSRDEEILNLKKWCEDHSIKLISILVICSDKEIWKARFNKRSENPALNQLITDFDELEKHYRDLNIEPIEDELVVDTKKSIGVILDRLIKLTYINAS